MLPNFLLITVTLTLWIKSVRAQSSYCLWAAVEDTNDTDTTYKGQFLHLFPPANCSSETSCRITALYDSDRGYDTELAPDPETTYQCDNVPHFAQELGLTIDPIYGYICSCNGTLTSPLPSHDPNETNVLEFANCEAQYESCGPFPLEAQYCTLSDSTTTEERLNTTTYCQAMLSCADTFCYFDVTPETPAGYTLGIGFQCNGDDVIINSETGEYISCGNCTSSTTCNGLQVSALPVSPPRSVSSSERSSGRSTGTGAATTGAGAAVGAAGESTQRTSGTTAGAGGAGAMTRTGTTATNTGTSAITTAASTVTTTAGATSASSSGVVAAYSDLSREVRAIFMMAFALASGLVVM